MCFNDDFDFDGYDDYHGVDDDFSEDMFEEEFEPEQDEFEPLEEPDGPASPESVFSFREAFIIGGMIVGQAYEESLDEKEQQRQLRNENKDED